MSSSRCFLFIVRVIGLFFIVIFFLFVPLGGFFYSFNLLPFFSLGLELSFFEVCFVGVLLSVFISILFYSYYYLESSFFFFFINLVFIFVLSIVFLIRHSRGLIFLLGWDGLGVSSYLLIKFYNNWRRINGGFVTVLTNRLGDAGLFWLFCFFLFSSYLGSRLHLYPLFFFLFFFFCFTKRAQAPFRSWLPLAIRAPTPVSSLVHSSTLVTAGIFVLLKYYYLILSRGCLLIMWIGGSLTLFVSGVMSLTEQDGKKVIALSTLSQLGVLMMGLGGGFNYLVFCHLLTHAFFKSCLFIQIGVFIHSCERKQDSRLYRNSFFLRKFSFTIFLVCLVRLCGLCFRRGFMRKDLLIIWGGFSSYSFFGRVLLVLSLVFTFLYSFRLLLGVLRRGRFSFFFFEENKLGRASGFFLVLLGVSFGWWYVYNIRFSPLCFRGFEKGFPLFLLGVLFIIFFFSFFLFLKFRRIGYQDDFLFFLRGSFVGVPFKFNYFLDYFFLSFFSFISRGAKFGLLGQKGSYGVFYFFLFLFFFFCLLY